MIGSLVSWAFAVEGAHSVAYQVHVSIDDLPWQVERGQAVELPAAAVAAWNRKLREHLAVAGAPATVFFNCERLGPTANELSMWAEAGHALGNHTARHLAARQVTPAAFIDDTAACQRQLAAAGHTVRWFRYPYLGYGADEAGQEAIRGGLLALGLTNVPIAAPTSEWVFAYRYRIAKVVGDTATQQAVLAAYLDHMDQALVEADRLIRTLEGRSAPITVLLHANELNGDHLGEVLQRWRARGAAFVPVETVMADELYRRAPVWTTPWSRPWPLRARGLPADGELGWFREEEARVRAAWPLPEPPWPTGVPPE